MFNLYVGYLIDSGLDARVLPAQNPVSLNLLQIKLVDNGILNLLFVPLGKDNFKTLSLIQFYTHWEQHKRNEIDSLKLINALNQKMPVGKLSLNAENILEYHYYLPVPSNVPLSKEEFIECTYLILSQLEMIYAIWPTDESFEVMLKKAKEM